MKEMKYIRDSHMMILDQLADDGVELWNIPHTCITENAAFSVKSVVRDSLSAIHNIHSFSDYFATLYYVNAEKEAKIVERAGCEVVKGDEVTNWIMQSLPEKFGAFAVLLRPKIRAYGILPKNVWVFMMR